MYAFAHAHFDRPRDDLSGIRLSLAASQGITTVQSDAPITLDLGGYYGSVSVFPVLLLDQPCGFRETTPILVVDQTICVLSDATLTELLYRLTVIALLDVLLPHGGDDEDIEAAFSFIVRRDPTVKRHILDRRSAATDFAAWIDGDRCFASWFHTRFVVTRLIMG